MENLDKVIAFLKANAANISLSLLLLIGGWIFINIVSGALKNRLNAKKVAPELVPFTTTLLQVTLKIALLITIAGNFGVKTTSFVAILGAAGLAIGMALKDSLNHFASGVVLLWYRPFKVGDCVDGGGVSGTVKELQLFATVLTTPDNKTIIVPNGQLLNGTVTNFSTQATRRVDITFGIAYSDDFEVAKKELMGLIQADERILKDPAPFVRVSNLGASSVDITTRSWVKKEDYWAVYFDLMENTKKRFDEVGLNFPFPQSEVWMHQADS